MTQPRTYDPPAGTIPRRVIDHLRALPAGSPNPSTAELAAALDSDPTIIGPSLITAVKYGAVAVEKRLGRNFWRLGNGQPPAQPEGEEIDTDPPRQIWNTISAAPLMPIPGDEHIPPVEIKPRSRKLRIALWSDGELVIEREGQTTRFTAEETRQIVAYIDRMAVDDGGAA